MYQSLQLYLVINEYDYDECLNEISCVLAVYFMNDASMCVITSMNFLRCYEVRLSRLVMAWMLEIGFILRNFHLQIEIP